MLHTINKLRHVMGLLILLLVLFVPLTAVQAQGKPGGDRYEWLNDNNKGYYYFDKVTFGLAKDPYTTEQHLDVWIRLQFVDEGVSEEENLRLLNKMPVGAYQNLSYRMFRYWFRVRDRHYQLLEVADFDDSGRELENNKVQYSPVRWVRIIPGTDEDTWFLKLTAYKQALDEAKKNQ
ncbi:MAG TPA: hypothetical protein VN611_00910 [Patescibacteria group bacterium]|nr:hypothetical protein [Patescibacteria group bacterium]